MSRWTYVKGSFDLDVDCKYGQASQIYKIIADAPKITSSEFPAIFTIENTHQYPVISSNGFYHEALITVAGALRDRELEETCNEVEKFINYLNSGCGERTAAHGYIKVSDSAFDRECPNSPITTIKTFNINFSQFT